MNNPKYKVGDIVSLLRFDCYPNWVYGMEKYIEGEYEVTEVVKLNPTQSNEHGYRFKNVGSYMWPESAIMLIEAAPDPSYFGRSINLKLREFEELLDRNIKNLKHVRKL